MHRCSQPMHINRIILIGGICVLHKIFENSLALLKLKQEDAITTSDEVIATQRSSHEIQLPVS